MKGWINQVAIVTAVALTSAVLAAAQTGGAPASTPPESGAQQAGSSTAPAGQQQQAPGTASAEEAANETLAPTPFMPGVSAMLNMGIGFTLSNQITTTGGVLPQFASRTGFPEFGIRDQVGDMAAVEFRFGIGTNAQTFGNLSYVETRITEYTLDLAFTLPQKGPMRAYILAGGGLLDFAPTSNGNNTTGATGEVRFSGSYGGGIDFKVNPKIALRVEYRGLFYRTPDFNVPNATFSSWSHIAIPDIGLVYHF